MNTKQIVLNSGVACVIRELTAEDQETLTNQGRDFSENLNIMLSDSIFSIGNDDNITVEFVQKLLKNDRKKILIELRQFSLDYEEKFDFVFDWALTESGDLTKTEHSLNFNDNNIPCVPYGWVVDAMKKEESNNTGEYPIMFDSYSEMLNTHQKQEFVTRDDVVIKWTLPNGLAEESFSKLHKSQININTPLKATFPKQEMTLKSDNSKHLTAFNISKLSYKDIRDFRKKYSELEGSYDTKIKIQHPDNPSLSEQLDLISLPDFFFPGGGI